jgi:hypothetical protein
MPFIGSKLPAVSYFEILRDPASAGLRIDSTVNNDWLAFAGNIPI